MECIGNKKGECKINSFVIAESLATISFILNTICVITARQLYGAGSPTWLPHFGLMYWLKTILAGIGLIYLFISRVFSAKYCSRFLPIFTLLILLYSIPGVNFIFSLPFNVLFSYKNIVLDKGVTFEARIATQIVWSIPLFIVIANLLMKLARAKIASRVRTLHLFITKIANLLKCLEK